MYGTDPMLYDRLHTLSAEYSLSVEMLVNVAVKRLVYHDLKVIIPWIPLLVNVNTPIRCFFVSLSLGTIVVG